MKTIMVMSFALAIMMASCGNGDAEQARKDTVPGNTGAAPAAAPPPPSTSSNLQAIMDSTVIRMGRIDLTNNPTKDFAVLMRVHHAGVRNLIQEGLKDNRDSSMAQLARSIDADLRKEVVQLNRFIIDKRYQEKQAASKASNELMRAMTPANQDSNPTSDNEQQEFPRLLITALQTGDNLVKVMEDNGAGYDISGFAQEMRARNKTYIEKLKQLAMNN